MSHVNAASRAFPEPPFTPELIADFHAGALDDALAQHVQQRLADDPEAMGTLASLDATVDALRGLSTAETLVPPELRAASEATLARLEQTSPSVVGVSAVVPAAAPIPGAPPRRSHTALLAIAAMVAGVLAAGIGIGVLLLPGRAASPDAAGEVPPADAAVLLAAARAPQTEPLDVNRLARCLTANRLSGQSIVGAGYLVYEGSPAQVILTPSGRPGRFHALITRRDCDAGRPATIARTVVGD